MIRIRAYGRVFDVFRDRRNLGAVIRHKPGMWLYPTRAGLATSPSLLVAARQVLQAAPKT